MAEMKVVITKIGLAKITEATIENPLKLTHFAVGDGGGNPIEPNEDMTTLVNEKYRDFLNDTYTNENNLTIECVLRANAPITTGFKIFELGIFDADGDMIAISQTPEQYRPSNSEGVATEWIASVVLQLSNTDNITIEIPETVFATTDALQRLLERVEDLEKSKKQRIGTFFYTSDNKVPKDASVCDGSFIKQSEYKDLFKIIGHKYNNNIDPKDGTFKLPDGANRYLRGASDTRKVGGYEEDAMQKITGSFVGQINSANNDQYPEGVFETKEEFQSYYNVTAEGTNLRGRIGFDNSLVVRTAEENRVKGLFGLLCIWYK